MERISSDSIQIWLDLGLSKSEATVYLALIKLGQTKARDLWKVAQVARQDIYRILDELIKLGIIERVMKNPCEFRAFPAAESAEILLQQMEREREQKILALRQESEQFIRENAETSLMQLPNLGSEFSISEGKASLLKLKKGMERCQSTVELIITEPIVAKDSDYFEEALKEALHRGVIVRILVQRLSTTTLVRDVNKQLKQIENLSTRTISRKGLPILEIYDGKEAAFVALSKTDMSGEPYDSRPPMLWTDNASFVSTLREYFENVWQQADPVVQA